MNYEQWLEKIEELKKSNINTEKLNILKNESLNENIFDILEPKLIDLVNTKFEKSVSKLINELPMMFDDINYLDLLLTEFKKELSYIKELIEIKQISQVSKSELYKSLSEKINSVYDILLKEAKRTDQTGIFEITIKNNKINWSVENEL